MSMTFSEFAAAHGLMLNPSRGHPVPDGRIHRVPTEDKPRAQNGAYQFHGEWGWVQDWGVHERIQVWRSQDSRKMDRADRERAAAKAALRRAEIERDARRASKLAERRLADTELAKHPYLAAKGFPDELALVDAKGFLLVPMRPFQSYEQIAGVQQISADGTKLFTTGMSARGAAFVIGNDKSETWLCEGFATGLTLRAALRTIYRPARVICCFSAANMVFVSRMVHGTKFVFVDHDRINKRTGTRAGMSAAELIGAPWCQSPVEGEDANDLMLRAGIGAVADLMRQAITSPRTAGASVAPHGPP